MATALNNPNLVNDQEIEIPYEVTGTLVSAAGLVAAGRQIDQNPSEDIGPFCQPSLPETPSPNGDVNFSFFLTDADCPEPDTYYTLTILAWDDGPDPSLSQWNITFKTMARAVSRF